MAGAIGFAFALSGGIDVLRLATRPNMWGALLFPLPIPLVASLVGACIGAIVGALFVPRGRALAISASVFAFGSVGVLAFLFVVVLGELGDPVLGLRAVAAYADANEFPVWSLESVEFDSGDGCARIAMADGTESCCTFSSAYRGSPRVHVSCNPSCAEGDCP